MKNEKREKIITRESRKAGKKERRKAKVRSMKDEIR